MQSAVLRRVVSPILAVAPANDVHGFFTVPPGAIIETPDGFYEPGLVSIKLGERELLAFTRDIEERCELFAARDSN